MASKNLYHLVTALAVLGAILPPLTTSLKAELAKAKLPIPLKSPEPFYDGKESIYIFGGIDNNVITKSILRYNITSDTLETIGEMPSGGYRGSVQLVDKYIYYFGGYIIEVGEYVDIVKYDPVSNEAESVGKLPYDILHHTSFQLSSTANIVYFVFQLSSTVSKLGALNMTMTTYEFEGLVDLPNFRCFSSVVSGNDVYIFGDEATTQESLVTKVDMISLKIEKIYLSKDYSFRGLSSAVSDGSYAHVLLGPLDYTSDTNIDDILLTFVPEAPYGRVHRDVENLPSNDNEAYFRHPTSVYVQKLNRIYYFGGEVYNRETDEHTILDEIRFIDLGTTFSCSGKPDGKQKFSVIVNQSIIPI